LVAHSAVERTPQSTGGPAGLVNARLGAQALPGFPGALPTDLASAYKWQDEAIGLWPSKIAGWKIGRLSPEQERQFGQLRLAGPIFDGAVRQNTAGTSTAFAMFVGGFAAVESEYVFRLKTAAPAAKTTWTQDEAADLVDALHIGIETAGSPMAAINDIGAMAIISDFGNNAGLILGPAIADWRTRSLESLTVVTSVNGLEAGRGGAVNIPGGPLEALRFLLENCAARGLAVPAGTLISTGAATGIHNIRVGQSAVADFGRDGRIECHAVAATPSVSKNNA